jgi:hypothetical protein
MQRHEHHSLLLSLRKGDRGQEVTITVSVISNDILVINSVININPVSLSLYHRRRQYYHVDIITIAASIMGGASPVTPLPVQLLLTVHCRHVVYYNVCRRFLKALLERVRQRVLAHRNLQSQHRTCTTQPSAGVVHTVSIGQHPATGCDVGGHEILTASSAALYCPVSDDCSLFRCNIRHRSSSSSSSSSSSR